MTKPSRLFWLIAVIALLWGAFGVFDFYMTLSGNEAYLKDFPPDMIAWIQGFALWRKAIWALGVFSALIAPVFILMRKAIAVPIFWFGAAMMLIGFIGHDLLLANGAKMYGTEGLVASVVIAVITIALALYAGRAKSKGYLV